MEKTVGEIGILNSDLFSDQFFLQCTVKYTCFPAWGLGNLYSFLHCMSFHLAVMMDMDMRWVAKLVARLLATAALWAQIQTALNNSKWAT